MCTCVWQSLTVLRWPSVVGRTLKSSYWLSSNGRGTLLHTVPSLNRLMIKPRPGRKLVWLHTLTTRPLQRVWLLYGPLSHPDNQATSESLTSVWPFVTPWQPGRFRESDFCMALCHTLTTRPLQRVWLLYGPLSHPDNQAAWESLTSVWPFVTPSQPGRFRESDFCMALCHTLTTRPLQRVWLLYGPLSHPDNQAASESLTSVWPFVTPWQPGRFRESDVCMALCHTLTTRPLQRLMML